MTRSIEDIDFIIVIVELHYGSSYGDTTLFFNIHPVRRCRLLYLVALYQPSKQVVTEKVEVDINTEEQDNQIGSALADKLRGELELIDGVYPEFQVEEYLKGELAPVFFGSALNNFGVQELLDCFVEIAPSPRPVKAEPKNTGANSPFRYSST